MSSSNCQTAYVEVYNGNSTESDLVGRFCGSEIPFTMYSTANEMFIVYKSAPNGLSKGFKAFYKTGKFFLK